MICVNEFIERLPLKNGTYKGKIVVVIAHRLSTVKNADNIVVMNNGQIVEKGIHENYP